MGIAERRRIGIICAMEIEADIHTEYNKNDGSVCCSFSGDRPVPLTALRKESAENRKIP